MYNPFYVPLGDRRKYAPHGYRGTPNVMALLLGLDLIERIMKIRNKPQLTLLLMGGMSVVHFRPELLRPLLLGGGRTQFGDFIQELCMHPTAMLQGFQWSGTWLGLRRFFLSALIHGDDWHLLYNMASFLAKGVSLEHKMGVNAYAGLLAHSLVTSQAIMLLLSWILMAWLGIEGPMHTCTVGFSGVLFALKYVLTRNDYGMAEMLGFKFRVRYATWVELVVMWLLVPNSSFLGHLSGILAGVLFTEMPVLPSFLRLVPDMIGIHSRRPPTYGRGTVGGGGEARGARASRAGASSGTYSSAPDTRARARYDKAAAEERDVQEALQRSMADARADVLFAPRDEGVRVDLRGERQGDVGDAPPVAPSAPRSEDLVHDNYSGANGLRARRIPSSVEL